MTTRAEGMTLLLVLCAIGGIALFAPPIQEEPVVASCYLDHLEELPDSAGPGDQIVFLGYDRAGNVITTLYSASRPDPLYLRIEAQGECGGFIQDSIKLPPDQPITLPDGQKVYPDGSMEPPPFEPHTPSST